MKNGRLAKRRTPDVTKRGIAKILTSKLNDKFKDSLIFYTCDSMKVIEAVTETFIEIMKEGKSFRLEQFGGFRVGMAKRKNMKDPNSDKHIQLPPHGKVSFSPSLYLKEHVKGLRGE